MAKQIQLQTDKAQFLPLRNSIAFPAIVDGKTYTCLVTMPLLMDRFGSGAGHVQLQNTFNNRIKAIETLARNLIDASQPNAAGEFIIGNSTVP
jgi:hypothetical protein